jgi:hypothetical protein
MTRDEATEIVRMLSIEFKMPVPAIKWHGNVTNGRYRHGVIVLGPRMWRGVDCVLHEFAHYLEYRSVCRYRAQDIGCHGPAFHDALTSVAEAWYGDATQYAWGTEYKHLAQAGPKQRKGE